MVAMCQGLDEGFSRNANTASGQGVRESEKRLTPYGALVGRLPHDPRWKELSDPDELLLRRLVDKCEKTTGELRASLGDILEWSRWTSESSARQHLQRLHELKLIIYTPGSGRGAKGYIALTYRTWGVAKEVENVEANEVEEMEVSGEKADNDPDIGGSDRAPGGAGKQYEGFRDQYRDDINGWRRHKGRDRVVPEGFGEGRYDYVQSRRGHDYREFPEIETPQVSGPFIAAPIEERARGFSHVLNEEVRFPLPPESQSSMITVDATTCVPRDPTERRRLEELVRRFNRRARVDKPVGAKDTMTAGHVLRVYPADWIRGSMDAIETNVRRGKIQARHIGLLRSYCEHYEEWVAPRDKVARLRVAPTTDAPTAGGDARVGVDLRRPYGEAPAAAPTREERSLGLGAALEAIMGRVGR